MFTAAVLLGGNLGEVSAGFAAARKALSAAGHKVTGESALYRSPAWGFEAEQSFLNQALLVQTTSSPRDFLEFLLRIEAELGRIRMQGAGYTSRTLDIDILLWDQLVLDEPGLQIPHPRMHLRRFALAPLAEIAPGMPHPLLGGTVADLLEQCPDDSPVKKLGE